MVRLRFPIGYRGTESPSNLASNRSCSFRRPSCGQPALTILGPYTWFTAHPVFARDFSGDSCKRPVPGSPLERGLVVIGAGSVARVGRIDRRIGEPPCARRCRRTEARKTAPRPSLMKLFELLSQD